MADDPRWPGVLDALERDAIRLQSDVDDPGAPYAPPADLGPLPGSLRGRATEVLEHIEGAVHHVEHRLGEVRTELGRVRREVARRTTAGHEPNGGFDTRA